MSDRQLHDMSTESFEFSFEGREVRAWPGQSVAAALLSADILTLRLDEFGEPKGVFCGIGSCWECRCEIDEETNVRACMTAARPGMVVRIQHGVG